MIRRSSDDPVRRFCLRHDRLERVEGALRLGASLRDHVKTGVFARGLAGSADVGHDVSEILERRSKLWKEGGHQRRVDSLLLGHRMRTPTCADSSGNSSIFSRRLVRKALERLDWTMYRGRMLGASAGEVTRRNKMKAEVKECPHCRSRLSRWAPPADSSWGTGIQLVCFADDCPYYIRGWRWMKERYEQNASYRYRYDPRNGQEGPLPVWSKNALREGIMDDEEEA